MTYEKDLDKVNHNLTFAKHELLKQPDFDKMTDRDFEKREILIRKVNEFISVLDNESIIFED